MFFCRISNRTENANAPAATSVPMIEPPEHEGELYIKINFLKIYYADRNIIKCIMKLNYTGFDDCVIWNFWSHMNLELIHMRFLCKFLSGLSIVLYHVVYLSLLGSAIMCI